MTLEASVPLKVAEEKASGTPVPPMTVPPVGSFSPTAVIDCPAEIGVALAGAQPTAIAARPSAPRTDHARRILSNVKRISAPSSFFSVATNSSALISYCLERFTGPAPFLLDFAYAQASCMMRADCIAHVARRRIPQ